MEIDMQVALGAHLQVDHGMAREAFQHVVQKADAGVDVGFAGAVQVQRDGDLGFAGFAFDGGGSHGASGGKSGSPLIARRAPKG